jgi:2-dehydropantoate 2-reductase
MDVERGAILVWGAGAIGGTIGAHLVRSGEDVTFVDRDRDHVAAMQRKGLGITGPMVEFTVAAKAVTPDQLQGRFARVFLCVKAQDTADASRALLPHITEDGYVVSAQNGLNELTMAKILGEARTMGCFVNFGADYMQPGVIHYAGRGSVVIGEIDGRETERLEALHQLLRKFEDRAMLTRNIWGYLWGKLAYGAMLIATALTNASIADCLASERHRRLFIALAREPLAVAAARKVVAEAFDGFDPTAFRPGMSEAAALSSLDQLVAFNRRSAKTHSGIWRDLAVRKRRTETEVQLSPVVELGGQHGVPTPLTARLIELIRDIETGRRAQGWEALDILGEAVPA